jgi:hypothetical protein
MTCRLPDSRGLSIVVCPTLPDQHPTAESKAALKILAGTNFIAEGVRRPFNSPIVLLPERCLPSQAPDWSGAAFHQGSTN